MSTPWHSAVRTSNIQYAPHSPDRAEAMDPCEPGSAKHVGRHGLSLCAKDHRLIYRPVARDVGPRDSASSHVGFRTVRRQD